MAAQSLIEQHVIFVAQGSLLDVDTILSNSLVQSLAANSAGNNLVISIDHYYHWDTVNLVWTANSFLHLYCYVSTTFQATIQSNIPNLRTQLPQFQIFTWGNPTTFGN